MNKYIGVLRCNITQTTLCTKTVAKSYCVKAGPTSKQSQFFSVKNLLNRRLGGLGNPARLATPLYQTQRRDIIWGSKVHLFP